MKKNKNKSRDDINKERNEIWAQAAERANKRKTAKKEIELKKPTAKLGDDGRLMIIHSWGQELPAAHDSEYFWNVLEDLRKNMTREAICRFFIDTKVAESDEEVNLLGKFCLWAINEAENSAWERDRKREEQIRDVRRDTGFYESEGMTEEEFEENKGI